MKEFLKTLGIEDSLISKIVAEHNKSVSESLDGYIPKHRFDEVNEKYKNEQAEVTKLKGEIKSLNPEKSQAEIERLESELANAKGTIKGMELNNKLNKYVGTLEIQPIDLDDLRLDLSDIDDNNFEEKISSQLSQLHESKPYLFKKKGVANIKGADKFTNVNSMFESNSNGESTDFGKIASEVAGKPRKDYFNR